MAVSSWCLNGNSGVLIIYSQKMVEDKVFVRTIIEELQVVADGDAIECCQCGWECIINDQRAQVDSMGRWSRLTIIDCCLP